MPLSTWSNIAVRDVQNGAVYFAWPFRVIDDGPRGLFLAQRRGAVGRVPRGYPDDRAMMLQQLSSTAPDLVELTWARTVSLDLWSPGDWWSTRVFWDETDDRFLCYYVDFVRLKANTNASNSATRALASVICVFRSSAITSWASAASAIGIPGAPPDKSRRGTGRPPRPALDGSAKAVSAAASRTRSRLNPLGNSTSHRGSCHVAASSIS